MGVPKYFSFVIQNYPTILKNLDFFTIGGNKIHKLFVDANSIIYDCKHKLKEADFKSHDELENKIINDVITYLDDLIKKTNPIYGTYITFDGIPPFMKMEQQRMRRGRALFFEKYADPNKWSLNNITPTMPFMNKLSAKVYKHFEKMSDVLCSCSDERGEGEQKIMKYIRENNMSNKNVAIYGLDADLIMLTLLHLKYCKNIYVFREAPEFMKSKIPVSVKHAEEIYFVDIGLLGKRIPIEMGWESSDRILMEYVFVCFFLGNDFLPHIESINIHTNGIDVLFDGYNNSLKRGEYLVNLDYSINNVGLKKFIQYLLKDADKRIVYEKEELRKYKDKMMRRKYDDERMENYKSVINVCECERVERVEKKEMRSEKYYERLCEVIKYYVGCEREKRS